MINNVLKKKFATSCHIFLCFKTHKIIKVEAHKEWYPPISFEGITIIILQMKTQLAFAFSKVPRFFWMFLHDFLFIFKQSSFPFANEFAHIFKRKVKTMNIKHSILPKPKLTVYHVFLFLFCCLSDFPCFSFILESWLTSTVIFPWPIQWSKIIIFPLFFLNLPLVGWWCLVWSLHHGSRVTTYVLWCILTNHYNYIFFSNPSIPTLYNSILHVHRYNPPSFSFFSVLHIFQVLSLRLYSQ